LKAANTIISAVVLVFFCFILSVNVYSQDNWWKYKTELKRQKFANCKKTFVNIGNGFNYANVYEITPYFGTEVYLSILSDQKGYYSPDQTKFILDNFLMNNSVNSFKWRNSNRSENYAFATGKYKYNKNGFIDTYDVSVSLKYVNDSWIIDQIIIN
jgi:hypothetical protein